MKTLSRDARGFIEGITQYIRKEGKTSVLPKVETLLGKVAASAQKETVAHVATSVALWDEEKRDIERLMYRFVGHPVTLDCRVDSTVLGGMKIQIGDWVVDTSLEGQLEAMAKDIL